MLFFVSWHALALNDTARRAPAGYNWGTPEERSVVTWMTDKKRRRLSATALNGLFQNGRIAERLREYVALCHCEAGGEEQFPNLAGFCRYLGVGLGRLRGVGAKYPDVYDELVTLLEDEALNASHIPAKSAMLTATYFKQRLGYAEKELARDAKAGEVRVVFDHDILEAGA